MSTTNQEFKAREDYVSYLETNLCVKAFRIGELEAALFTLVIYINTGKDIPTEHMNRIQTIIENGKPVSYETFQALKKIYGT